MNARITTLIPAVFLLSACTTFEANQRFLCPNIISNAAYQNAFGLVNGPFVIPNSELRERCEGHSDAACTYLEADGRASIYIAEGVINREAALFHEVCHVYRTRILGIPYEQDAQHIGWIRATR